MLMALRAGVLLLMIVAVVSADEGPNSSWPSVRGPHFNGHSDDAVQPQAWGVDGPPVLWIRKLGQGYSAFVAEGDRVYTQAQHMTGQYVYCLEADTGDTIWEHWYDWPYETAGVYPGPRSTPTLYKDRVYFTSPDGLLGCLAADTGRQIWSVDLSDEYGIEGCDFGYACSATVVDDLVIMPVGGVEKNAGESSRSMLTPGSEIWRASDEPASYTPALPIKLDGRKLVVCYMQNALLVLDRTDGSEVLNRRLSHGYDEHSAWPIYEEPYLWLSAPFKAGCYLLDLSKPEEDAVWRSRQLSNDVCSSVLVDGFLYGFDIIDVQSKTHRPSRGIFRCMEFATGDERWSIGTGRPRRSSNADEFRNDIGQSGIVVVGDTLIILNELGELILLKADPEKPVELARSTILGGELTWTPPCYHRGRVYARNQSQAVCVYIGEPSELEADVALTIDRVANGSYYNLAHLVLAVEPEYAFDIPHDRWMIQWFLVGTGIIGFGCLLRTKSSQRNWHLDLVLWFLLGAVGTTLLGRLTQEFVFTWPVCLYAALEFSVRRPTVQTESAAVRFIRQRTGLFVFLVVCIAYFLICRRLSLVFEWAFLFGLTGALPIVWCARNVKSPIARSTCSSDWFRGDVRGDHSVFEEPLLTVVGGNQVVAFTRIPARRLWLEILAKSTIGNENSLCRERVRMTD